MKIIILGDSISTQQTGIHYYGKQLLDRMIGTLAHHQLSIVLPTADPDLPIKQHLVPIHDWIPQHLRWRQLWSIPRLLRSLKPDVVIELAHFGPFFLPPSIKRVTVIHDLTPVIHPEWHDRLSVWMHRLLLPGILRRADALIVNSQHTRSDLFRRYGIPQEKIHICYPSIVSPDHAIAAPKPLLRAPYILTVGTIEPRKNHLVILKAFEQIAARHQDLHLVIAGKKGWKYEPLIRQLHQSPVRDRVMLTGYLSRSKLWQWYRHAHSFVFASHYEGFGLPVLEALSFGLPVIVSQRTSLTELGGDAALYFEPDDVDGLAQQMLHLLEHPGEHQQRSESSDQQYQEISAMGCNLDFIVELSD